ncbi:hypothetical protein BDM02DRAFT_3125041 [Thelephora ganbajun]|uniref:Uncharacterized protein n=1 Tax=Thelephora ganbajun TaxID=370292 RepID=A0ACB6YXE7_THEGA|nr:hypothetical protein BDM02DRAFT_3125041 [Thelephora ganbajun]
METDIGNSPSTNRPRKDGWKQPVEINKLPLQYKPIQKLGHYTPRLCFGVAFPKEFIQFRRVVLENNVGNPDELSAMKSFFTLRTLVLPYSRDL